MQGCKGCECAMSVKAARTGVRVMKGARGVRGAKGVRGVRVV